MGKDAVLFHHTDDGDPDSMGGPVRRADAQLVRQHLEHHRPPVAMTTAPPSSSRTPALLLDFDGPVTALMPPPLNAQAADQARAALGGIELPEGSPPRRTTWRCFVSRPSPFQGGSLVVKRPAPRPKWLVLETADPSPEITDSWRTPPGACSVAIVSNNSEAAVRVFLARFDWGPRVRTLACRTPATVHLMKPHPYLVNQAMQSLKARPADCLLVGDSVSDMQAGLAAGVCVVGLAKTRERGFSCFELVPWRFSVETTPRHDCLPPGVARSLLWVPALLQHLI